MAKALAHRLALRTLLLVDRLPALPPASQALVQEVLQRLRHRVVRHAAERARLPRCKTNGELAVHHEAHALTQLLQERRALSRHRVPRAPPLRKLAVHQVAKALAHRLALRTLLLPVCLPALPAASQALVQEVHQRLRHRVVGHAAEHARLPRPKPERHRPVHQHAQPLAKLLHECRALNGHLHPGTETLGKLTIEHVLQAALHRLELPLMSSPTRLPAHPATRQPAI